jgi:hypothetical protein
MRITYGGSGWRPGAPSRISAGLVGGLFDIIFEKHGMKKKKYHKRSESEEENPEE